MSEPNHRDLIRRRPGRKRPRHAFLGLPEALQDEIMAALDKGRIPFEEAARRARAAGWPISGEAVRLYHRAVRAEKRRYRLREALTKALEAEAPEALDKLDRLLDLTLALTAARVQGKKGREKPIDVFKLLPELLRAVKECPR